MGEMSEKTCPFCGGKPLLKEVAWATGEIKVRYIKCTACKIKGPHRRDVDAAWAAWNVRQPAAPVQVTWHPLSALDMNPSHDSELLFAYSGPEPGQSKLSHIEIRAVGYYRVSANQASGYRADENQGWVSNLWWGKRMLEPTHWAYIPPLEAALQAGVPSGWKLVPVEPTLEMISAGAKQIPLDPEYGTDLGQREAAKDVYESMLSAAPTPGEGR